MRRVRVLAPALMSGRRRKERVFANITAKHRWVPPPVVMHDKASEWSRTIYRITVGCSNHWSTTKHIPKEGRGG